MNKTKLGRLGEDLACEYLVDKGYKIIGRNYREKWDELDIVARSQDKTLIFVEVKTINTAGGDENSMIMPEDNLTKSKMRKLKRACQSFALKRPEFVDENKGWRIDLVAITTMSDKEPKIRHYENI